MSRATTGGDQTQQVPCPFCGEEVCNNALPDHLTACGGVQA